MATSALSTSNLPYKNPPLFARLQPQKLRRHSRSWSNRQFRTILLEALTFSDWRRLAFHRISVCLSSPVSFPLLLGVQKHTFYHDCSGLQSNGTREDNSTAWCILLNINKMNSRAIRSRPSVCWPHLLMAKAKYCIKQRDLYPGCQRFSKRSNRHETTISEARSGEERREREKRLLYVGLLWKNSWTLAVRFKYGTTKIRISFANLAHQDFHK